MKDSIRLYFQDYPKSKRVYETSDGYLFHEDGDARLHSVTLADDRVEEHSKPAEDSGAEDGEGEGKTKAKAKR